MAYQLQILHASDQEAGVPALTDAIGFSAVMNALDDDTFENTLRLTSGDLFIAGPFFSASGDVYEGGEPGYADILLRNALGFDVAAVGNHEFDAVITPNPDASGPGLDGAGYPGTAFTFLSANLDYTNSPLNDFVVEAGGAPLPNTLTPSAIADVNGEEIGIVGAVTPFLADTANIGGVELTTGDITNATPIDEQVAALVEAVAPEVAAIEGEGVNKIILMTHLHEAEIEQALAAALGEQELGVDILIGGGSHRVMASGDGVPPLGEDETQQESDILLQPYPQEFEGVYYVNTGSNYRYLSQFVSTFDDQGVIIGFDDEASGTFATDFAGIERLTGVDIETLEEVKPLADSTVVEVVDGIVAAAIARAPVEQSVFGQTSLIAQPGFVALFDAEALALLATVDVGNLPDQLTFTADGTKLLVAGEGEKNEDSEHDNNPLGTIAVVDVSDPAAPTAKILDFTDCNGLEDIARAQGVRIQPGVSFEEDAEPEYIAVSPDGATAYVSLQENNALGVIDLEAHAIVDVLPLGTSDFSAENAIDTNDNGEIDVRNFPGLVGLRMPDSIATFEANGTTYIATANEGDGRGFDEDRVGDLIADGLVDAALVDELSAEGLVDDNSETEIGIERLEVSTIDGDTDGDGDGDIDVLNAFSSRSFSIFDTEGNLVFDSGDQLERFIAANFRERFNDDDGTSDENRSNNKGPEPEAIAVGEIDGRTYAFLGLERDSGIVV